MLKIPKTIGMVMRTRRGVISPSVMFALFDILMPRRDAMGTPD
jgi:hypothetical protein